MPLDVVAVIVTYNSAELIGRLLDSIPPAMGDLRFQVVVVDNDSTDDTVSVLEARDDITLLRHPNTGYAAGVNAGVAASEPSESILVLNPDVALHEGSVVAMLGAMRRTGAGIVAPRTVDDQGRLAFTLRRAPSIGRALGMSWTGWPVFSEHVQERARYAEPHTVLWAVGAVLLVGREVHDRLGGWDESFFLYSEETDFCLRAGDLGFTTFYEPSAGAMHVGGGSGRSARTEAMQQINRLKIYARYHGQLASLVYLAALAAREIRNLLTGHPHALRVILVPRWRPAEIGCSSSLIPR